jgi:hypothetical protein
LPLLHWGWGLPNRHGIWIVPLFYRWFPPKSMRQLLRKTVWLWLILHVTILIHNATPYCSLTVPTNSSVGRLCAEKCSQTARRGTLELLPMMTCWGVDR